MFANFNARYLSIKLVGRCTVVACQAVANIVKSSLGPVGLDKVFPVYFKFYCCLVPNAVNKLFCVLTFRVEN